MPIIMPFCNREREKKRFCLLHKLEHRQMGVNKTYKWLGCLKINLCPFCSFGGMLLFTPSFHVLLNFCSSRQAYCFSLRCRSSCSSNDVLFVSTFNEFSVKIKGNLCQKRFIRLSRKVSVLICDNQL